MAELPAEATAAIGRGVTVRDTVTAAPAMALAATFGRERIAFAIGDALPPLWHGLYGVPKLAPELLAEDGLPSDEPLLPAIPDFPRRLFGGARFTFTQPLRIGDDFRRESEIAGFDAKDGAAGAFLIARVVHRVFANGESSITEENDIIYRADAAARGAGGKDYRRNERRPAWRRTITPDPVLMFRHSAATFNANRLHYDRDYARGRGLPGLLVQGMLVARLMGELLHDELPERTIGNFAFRAVRPLYDTAPFTLYGTPIPESGKAQLWAMDSDGTTVMTATARFT